MNADGLVAITSIDKQVANDKIGFFLFTTGSPATARRILHAAADNLTPTVMELGGKDAMIVCDDADVQADARAAVGACFANAGQTCIAIERVLITPASEPRVVPRRSRRSRGQCLGGVGRIVPSGGDHATFTDRRDRATASLRSRRGCGDHLRRSTS